MQQEGVHPDSASFVAVLNACVSAVAIEEGRSAHEKIIQSGWDSDVKVGNCLVDMYAKCGSMEDAQRVFNKMPSHDVVSWNAILGGCAMHGHGNEALKHFEQMCEKGVQPDDITFVCLLVILGHAGYLQQAENMIKAMPHKPHVNVWKALLGTVVMWKWENVLLNRLELEPENASGYVLLSNIYAAAGNKHLCEKVEQQGKERGAKRQLGCTTLK
jgi:pentatricopeptide repeat protein